MCTKCLCGPPKMMLLVCDGSFILWHMCFHLELVKVRYCTGQLLPNMFQMTLEMGEPFTRMHKPRRVNGEDAKISQ